VLSGAVFGCQRGTGTAYGFRDRLIFPELLDQDIRLISIGVAAKIARVPSRTAIRLDGAIREGSFATRPCFGYLSSRKRRLGAPVFVAAQHPPLPGPSHRRESPD